MTSNYKIIKGILAYPSRNVKLKNLPITQFQDVINGNKTNLNVPMAFVKKSAKFFNKSTHTHDHAKEIKEERNSHGNIHNAYVCVYIFAYYQWSEHISQCIAKNAS